MKKIFIGKRTFGGYNEWIQATRQAGFVAYGFCGLEGSSDRGGQGA
jgi:hypothetical protein